jgi:hypothetical protein
MPPTCAFPRIMNALRRKNGMFPELRKMFAKSVDNNKKKKLVECLVLPKVGVLRASHKISDSKPITCWHDASKISSIWLFVVFQDLTGPGRSNGHGRAQLKISWHDRRKINGNKSKQNLKTLNVNLTAFLASNLLAQFSRQIVVQLFVCLFSRRDAWPLFSAGHTLPAEFGPEPTGPIKPRITPPGGVRINSSRCDTTPG